MARILLCTYRYTNRRTNLARTPEPLRTLADWARHYRDGASPRELLQRHTPGVGDDPAWITRADAASLRTQVDALETRAATFADRATAMQALPLFGVPFAVKDNIDVQGWPTTAACPAWRRIASHSAFAVARLIEAGAICVGKTNLDQFATGLVGTRSPYGRPASAFDRTRVSGGSSSGSALVVARGELPFALGTDTAGSGRVPAGFNNIVGLKPTPGRVSTAGVLPACRSLDCVSVFALTVDDAASVLSLIEGDDPQDAYSAFAPGRAAWPPRLRIGVPAAPLLDEAYREPWARALDQVRALGHETVTVDFAPLHKTADLLYGGPWVAERHATVEALMQQHPGAMDPTVRQVIERARHFSATDAFRGQYALRAARREAERLWGRVDALLVPTAPGHPSFAEVDAEPVQANARLGHYTNFVNLLGWCALALPAGFTTSGLPFGVTAIAPANADLALAHWGRAWQHAVHLPLGATDARAASAAPLREPASEPTLALAVVGAHLSGLPLNHQLLEREAVLREATRSAPHYKLYALPGTTPPKPGLVRMARGGASIELEVWQLPQRHVGSLLAGIAAPLGLGSVELADGTRVHGFVCEAQAVEGARDITEHGGWREYLRRSAAAPLSI